MRLRCDPETVVTCVLLGVALRLSASLAQPLGLRLLRPPHAKTNKHRESIAMV